MSAVLISCGSSMPKAPKAPKMGKQQRAQRHLERLSARYSKIFQETPAPLLFVSGAAAPQTQAQLDFDAACRLAARLHEAEEGLPSTSSSSSEDEVKTMKPMKMKAQQQQQTEQAQPQTQPQQQRAVPSTACLTGTPSRAEALLNQSNSSDIMAALFSSIGRDEPEMPSRPTSAPATPPSAASTSEPQQPPAMEQRKKKAPKPQGINVGDLDRARRALELVSSPAAAPAPTCSSASATSSVSDMASQIGVRAVICTGKKCARKGALEAVARLEELAGPSDTATPPAAGAVKFSCSGCQGLCGRGPVMRVKAEGPGAGQLFEGVASAGEVDVALAFARGIAAQRRRQPQPKVVEVAAVQLD